MSEHEIDDYSGLFLMVDNYLHFLIDSQIAIRHFSVRIFTNVPTYTYLIIDAWRVISDIIKIASGHQASNSVLKIKPLSLHRDNFESFHSYNALSITYIA